MCVGRPALQRRSLPPAARNPSQINGHRPTGAVAPSAGPPLRRMRRPLLPCTPPALHPSCLAPLLPRAPPAPCGIFPGGSPPDRLARTGIPTTCTLPLAAHSRRVLLSHPNCAHVKAHACHPPVTGLLECALFLGWATPWVATQEVAHRRRGGVWLFVTPLLSLCGRPCVAGPRPTREAMME
jgi:hypothetical protein